mmetsp:Transcript_11343/g.31833  ORF Transcript_11343/g.31833 Transcript_11343/m.31833 type:complete len:120 (+) Transcript_11343:74-433(+)
MLRIQVLGSYKHLLRAVRTSFANDPLARERATLRAREVTRSRVSEADEVKVKEYILHAEQATAFIRQNVVQVEVSEEGKKMELKLNENQKQSLRENENQHIYVEPPAPSRRRRKGESKS